MRAYIIINLKHGNIQNKYASSSRNEYLCAIQVIEIKWQVKLKPFENYSLWSFFIFTVISLEVQ